jgi:carotenoid cleavage dioxygenase-like enzyme
MDGGMHGGAADTWLCFCRMAVSEEGQHLCVYHTISPSGEKSEDFPVPMSRGQMIHDFAISEHFALFVDQALVFDPVPMFTQNALPIAYDSDTPSRILLMSRAAPLAPPRIFDLPDAVAFLHTANAWEEGDQVHLVLSRYRNRCAIGQPPTPPLPAPMSPAERCCCHDAGWGPWTSVWM